MSGIRNKPLNKKNTIAESPALIVPSKDRTIPLAGAKYDSGTMMLAIGRNLQEMGFSACYTDLNDQTQCACTLFNEVITAITAPSKSLLVGHPLHDPRGIHP